MNSVNPGDRFGMWVASESSEGKRAREKILCQCDCGEIRHVNLGNLTNGLTTGCGCKRLADNAARLRKHGYKSDLLYQTWLDMMGRCYNPNFCNFEHYGARGVKVCDEWASFEGFREAMEPHPGRGFSIDRRDNDGDYQPSNVRWSTQKEQTRNTRRNVLMTLDGVTRVALDWSEKLGIPHSTIYYRIKKSRPLGISDEVAIRASPEEFRRIIGGQASSVN